MPFFEVAFNLSGQLQVKCDDEGDAREYVSCLPAEQLVLWILSHHDITLDRDVAVASVAPSGRADARKREVGVRGRRRQ